MIANSIKFFGKLLILGGLLVITLKPLSVNAARFSGAYLLYVCSSDGVGKELVPGGHGVCQSYIAGIVDYHTLIKSLGTAPSVDFCLPKEITMNELHRIVANYLRLNRSQHEDFIAAPAVGLALYNAYPCD